MQDNLEAWQFYYNWQRPHSSLKGKTPAQYSSELTETTPIWEEIEKFYDPKNEHIQLQNYRQELAVNLLKKLK